MYLPEREREFDAAEAELSVSSPPQDGKHRTPRPSRPQGEALSIPPAKS